MISPRVDFVFNFTRYGNYEIFGLNENLNIAAEYIKQYGLVDLTTDERRKYKRIYQLNPIFDRSELADDIVEYLRSLGYKVEYKGLSDAENV